MMPLNKHILDGILYLKKHTLLYCLQMYFFFPKTDAQSTWYSDALDKLVIPIRIIEAHLIRVMAKISWLDFFLGLLHSGR